MYHVIPLAVHPLLTFPHTWHARQQTHLNMCGVGEVYVWRTWSHVSEYLSVMQLNEDWCRPLGQLWLSHSLHFPQNKWEWRLVNRRECISSHVYMFQNIFRQLCSNQAFILALNSFRSLCCFASWIIGYLSMKGLPSFLLRMGLEQGGRFSAVSLLSNLFCTLLCRHRLVVLLLDYYQLYTYSKMLYRLQVYSIELGTFSSFCKLSFT